MLANRLANPENPCKFARIFYYVYMKKEVWKRSKKYPEIEVSNFLRIRRYIQPVKVKRWKIDYLAVHVKNWKTREQVYCHRLFAESFLWLDIDNEKIQVCHKDDDGLNNNLENLFLWTAKDNFDDMVWKNRYRPANCKFDKEQINNIFILRSQGNTLKFIWDIYGVHLATISKILTYKTYNSPNYNV